ncbi:helix-turn-helix domain-containing protein [Nonomuraea turkmeniaca]|uniref:Helix-turn-helix domain-containing protein n=1 Tax=Nonomuraea turkmeniaca TaxID=103838 RepID=A0A5S4F498_9ACTN|nr:helix-turn-helix domain-containing protein [Nonomuraea turkmeniaca]TMR10972.1 helix-turn-helix domain-containing protein [Nonomuraea turkmeniaca]
MEVATFAERLAEAMDRQGLSARAVARALKAKGYKGVGFSNAYISALIKGKSTNPGIETVNALADLLGVQRGWLLGDDPAEPLTEEERRQEDHIRQRVEAVGIEYIAERWNGMDALKRVALVKIVDAVFEAEGLGERPRQPEPGTSNVTPAADHGDTQASKRGSDDRDVDGS